MNDVNDIKVKWPLVVAEWEKIYLNYIDLGNYTMFRMSIFKTATPRLGLFVAIEDRGAFFFGMDKTLHKDYVGAKLGLEGDRAQVADFLNAQLQNNEEQQGHYYADVVQSAEPYGKIGEDKIKPWAPEII